jgi:hypothetical protein
MNAKRTKWQLLEQAAALVGQQAAERQRRVEAQAHVNASNAPASDPLHAADDDDRGAVAGAAGADEEVDDEDSTTLYNLYKPKRLAEGSPHPDPVRSHLNLNIPIDASAYFGPRGGSEFHAYTQLL